MNEEQDTSTWDEFEWEKALRESDEFAARYFQLLQRFCDLPGGEELIARQMERDFDGDLSDCNLDCANCADRWDCEFSTTDDWDDAEDEVSDGKDVPRDGAETDADDHGEPEDGADSGDPFFYETDPTFDLLRQTAIGWCNVYAAILTVETRVPGVRILFHVGRALANLAYSIGDGLYEQPSANVAFAKRSLAQLNVALGLLNQLTQDKPRLDKLLDTIRTHMLRARQAMVDHLQRCRERLNAPSES